MDETQQQADEDLSNILAKQKHKETGIPESIMEAVVNG